MESNTLEQDYVSQQGAPGEAESLRSPRLVVGGNVALTEDKNFVVVTLDTETERNVFKVTKQNSIELGQLFLKASGPAQPNQGPGRYGQLLAIIEQIKPKTIVEVGTWNGLRAIQMASIALKHHKDVHYIGYDLFEDATAETDAEELNVKKHYTVAEVSERLAAFAKENPGFTFELVKGNTRETLKGAAKADLAFLDGGHSVETIKSDLENLSGSKVIVLDDWYDKDEQGKCPDLEKYGCNKVLEGREFVVLGHADRVKDGGLVRFAVIGWQPPNSNLQIRTKNCVPDTMIQENIKASLARNLHQVPLCRAHERRAVICSGGPSLVSYVPMIAQHKKRGDLLFCVKHAHDELIARGVVPWGCILLDPRQHVKDFIENPHPDVNYFVSSMCHPTTYEKLVEKKAKIWVYHAAVGAGEEKLLTGKPMIPGGPASAIRGLTLLYHLGFRKFDTYAWDCYYPVKPDLSLKDANGQPRYVEVSINNRIFWSDYERLAEFQFFEKAILTQLGGIDINVHGDGPMADLIRNRDRIYESKFADVFHA